MTPTPVVPAETNAGGVLPALNNPYHARARVARSRRERFLHRLSEASTGRRRVLAVHEGQTVRFKGKRDVAQMVWLAARCVGRWPSGAPLALAPLADDPQFATGTTSLGDDPGGLACPLGAHVRRANPRDDVKPYPAAESLSMSEAHRLLRRARMFGPTLFNPKNLGVRRPTRVAPRCSR